MPIVIYNSYRNGFRVQTMSDCFAPSALAFAYQACCKLALLCRFGRFTVTLSCAVCGVKDFSERTQN
jgi:hypothetical protein